MRYELYRYDYEMDWYNFIMESDTIDALHGYAIFSGILNEKKKDNRKGKWIFIDNEPKEYNLLDLGYMNEIPSNEEVKKVIQECKFQRHFHPKGMFKKDKIDFDVYNREYEKTMKQATEETDAICSVLFSLKPIFKLPSGTLLKQKRA